MCFLRHRRIGETRVRACSRGTIAVVRARTSGNEMTDQKSQLPRYLRAEMAPVPDEIDAVDLSIEGTLPSELDGMYLRNGPNPPPGTDPTHFFVGHGMIHGVRLAEGRARSYRNRWVQTPILKGARPVRPDGTRDLTASTANTSVLSYAGAILALVENSLPFAMTPELATLGPYDFGGKLRTPMTAHPKFDVASGELHFFGYDFRPPFVTYHVASADGRLLRSEVIDVKGPTMMHDFGLTANHVVWLDLPVVLDMALTATSRMPYRWTDDYPPRIGIMPRTGGAADVRWLSVKPGYAFHVANAYEDDGGRIVIDAARYDREAINTTWRALGGASILKSEQPLSGGVLYRWVIDPVNGLISEEPLDDLAVDFPMINLAYTGRPHRFTYATSLELLADEQGSKIAKYDRSTGQRSVHELGKGWIGGEVSFVPARDASGEDDGWLVSIVTHETANAAQLVVLDASHIADSPVATVHLPRRVPTGFHGAWIAASELPEP
jgi:carotenoid cleavage dioxygenase